MSATQTKDETNTMELGGMFRAHMRLQQKANGAIRNRLRRQFLVRLPAVGRHSATALDGIAVPVIQPPTKNVWPKMDTREMDVFLARFKEQLPHLVGVIDKGAVLVGACVGNLVLGLPIASVRIALIGTSTDDARKAHEGIVFSVMDAKYTVQIDWVLYDSARDVVDRVAIPSEAIVFDGEQVWFSQDAAAAFAVGVNSLNLKSRSMDYEARLAAAFGQGFAISLPNLEFKSIDRSNDLEFQESDNHQTLVLGGSGLTVRGARDITSSKHAGPRIVADSVTAAVPKKSEHKALENLRHFLHEDIQEVMLGGDSVQFTVGCMKCYMSDLKAELEWMCDPSSFRLGLAKELIGQDLVTLCWNKHNDDKAFCSKLATVIIKCLQDAWSEIRIPKSFELRTYGDADEKQWYGKHYATATATTTATAAASDTKATPTVADKGAAAAECSETLRGDALLYRYYEVCTKCGVAFGKHAVDSGGQVLSSTSSSCSASSATICASIAATSQSLPKALSVEDALCEWSRLAEIPGLTQMILSASSAAKSGTAAVTAVAAATAASSIPSKVADASNALVSEEEISGAMETSVAKIGATLVVAIIEAMQSDESVATSTKEALSKATVLVTRFVEMCDLRQKSALVKTVDSALCKGISKFMTPLLAYDFSCNFCRHPSARDRHVSGSTSFTGPQRALALKFHDAVQRFGGGSSASSPLSSSLLSLVLELAAAANAVDRAKTADGMSTEEKDGDMYEDLVRQAVERVLENASAESASAEADTEMELIFGAGDVGFGILSEYHTPKKRKEMFEKVKTSLAKKGFDARTVAGYLLVQRALVDTGEEVDTAEVKDDTVTYDGTVTYEDLVRQAVDAVLLKPIAAFEKGVQIRFHQGHAGFGILSGYHTTKKRQEMFEKVKASLATKGFFVSMDGAYLTVGRTTSSPVSASATAEVKDRGIHDTTLSEPRDNVNFDRMMDPRSSETTKAPLLTSSSSSSSSSSSEPLLKASSSSSSVESTVVGSLTLVGKATFVGHKSKTCGWDAAVDALATDANKTAERQKTRGSDAVVDALIADASKISECGWGAGVDALCARANTTCGRVRKIFASLALQRDLIILWRTSMDTNEDTSTAKNWSQFYRSMADAIAMEASALDSAQPLSGVVAADASNKSSTATATAAATVDKGDVLAESKGDQSLAAEHRAVVEHVLKTIEASKKERNAVHFFTTISQPIFWCMRSGAIGRDDAMAKIAAALKKEGYQASHEDGHLKVERFAPSAEAQSEYANPLKKYYLHTGWTNAANQVDTPPSAVVESAAVSTDADADDSDDVVLRTFKIALVGPGGVGKTTFAETFPNAVKIAPRQYGVKLKTSLGDIYVVLLDLGKERDEWIDGVRQSDGAIIMVDMSQPYRSNKRHAESLSKELLDVSGDAHYATILCATHDDVEDWVEVNGMYNAHVTATEKDGLHVPVYELIRGIIQQPIYPRF